MPSLSLVSLSILFPTSVNVCWTAADDHSYTHGTNQKVDILQPVCQSNQGNSTETDTKATVCVFLFLSQLSDLRGVQLHLGTWRMRQRPKYNYTYTCSWENVYQLFSPIIWSLITQSTSSSVAENRQTADIVHLYYQHIIALLLSSNMKLCFNKTVLTGWKHTQRWSEWTGDSQQRVMSGLFPFSLMHHSIIVRKQTSGPK